jgi:triacylglycerol lipase
MTSMFRTAPLIVLAVGLGAVPAVAAAGGSNTVTKGPCVILLHGLARTSRSMQPLADLLSRHGYTAFNIDYPSTKDRIEHLTETHLAPAVARCRRLGLAPVHFVTHSMGGIMVRQYFQNRPAPQGSRVVMLGPPNRGSELAGWLKHFFLYKWVMGPAGQQLDVSAQSIPNRLRPVSLEIGVIAGTFSINPIFSAILPGPDDGTVSLERTKLPGLADFVRVNASHPFIMTHRRAMEQTVHFLSNGKFNQ